MHLRLLGNDMRLSHRLAALAVCAAALVVSNARCQGQEQSDSKPRKMVTKIVPAYPSLAQRMSMAGTVKIEGIIAPNGTPKSADVLGGHPVLAQAAIDAFRRSKWEPASHETKEIVIFNFHP
jgi:TonB family protein